MNSGFLGLEADRSVLLFGPRGVGKTKLIQDWAKRSKTHLIDLMRASVEQQYALSPQKLRETLKNLPAETTHVVIDEIQKVPELLGIVRDLIESGSPHSFVLTGSSALKLKQSASLLAGRALVCYLHPLSFLEQDKFKLAEALQFGQLPEITKLKSPSQKFEVLQTYVSTYLQEEIAQEGLTRDLMPFRRFIESAALLSGEITNFSKVAREAGVSVPTIKEYYSILEDSLLGFFLDPYHGSSGKRLAKKPKFFVFDLGVKNALARTLEEPLKPLTNAYQAAFEHLIVLEIFRLISYFAPDFHPFYLRTKDGEEINLIIARPSKPLLCIQIESSDRVSERDLLEFEKLCSKLPNCESIYLYNGPDEISYSKTRALPWQEGLKAVIPGLTRDPVSPRT